MIMLGINSHHGDAAAAPFKGAAAARYAYERMAAESILAVRLMDARLRAEAQGAKSEVRSAKQ